MQGSTEKYQKILAYPKGLKALNFRKEVIKMLKVKNMVSDRGTTIANQFYITGNGTVTFQSYDSTIIEIDYNNKVVYIHPDYDYSVTTGKYRNIFLRDEGFTEIATLKELNKAIASGSITTHFGTFTIKKVA